MNDRRLQVFDLWMPVFYFARYRLLVRLRGISLGANPLTETCMIALTGFLGSGKTTLLQRMVSVYQAAGMKVAVVINELGDVHVEQLSIADQPDSSFTVPLRELLGGCICCSVRGDLGLTLLELLETEKPDVIIVEATGAANPLDLIEAMTETSLLQRAKLTSVVTVVDSLFFADQAAKGVGKTWRLLREQVRCASVVVLNKLDLLEAQTPLSMDKSAILELAHLVKTHHPRAVCLTAERCDLTVDRLLELLGGDVELKSLYTHVPRPENAERSRFKFAFSQPGESHRHLLVHTIYLERPFDSRDFSQIVSRLPDTVYRAKGIVSFADTGERVTFQFAYKQLECRSFVPQRDVPDVIVLIGEGLSVPDLDTIFAFYR